jgi:glycosyltransferase involved in cell wall biosynthesis
MRVVLIDNICDPSQPGKQGHSDIVWNIAEQLCALGDDVHIVGPYDLDGWRSAEQCPIAGLAVHRFKMPLLRYRNVIGHVLIVLSAWRALRGVRGIDIVHTTDAFSAGILSSLLNDVPVVLTTAGNVYERIEVGNPPIDITAELGYKLVSKAAVKHCARIMATSQYMRDWWIRTGAPPRAVSFVPLGVDSRLFEPSCRVQAGKLDPEAPGSTHGVRRLLFVGRLAAENNVEYVLHAANLLRARGHKFELTIIGDGPEKQRLEAMARALEVDENVHWEGWADLESLPDFYGSTDVFVVTRVANATPRVILQAMACGTPIVAFEYGGITDYLADGKTALLARRGDARDLAEKLERVLLDSHLGECLGQRAAAYASSHLSWATIVRTFRQEVYEQILRSR